MAGEDPAYVASIKADGCLLRSTGRCVGIVEAHHPTHLRGTGHDKRRAHDRNALPLCAQHHVGELHGLTGFFKGWTRERLQRWQDERIAEIGGVL